MTGSEWFDSRPGGLNRYFTELYEALRRHGNTDVEAIAFGSPVRSGRTWGATGQSLPKRVVSSRVDVREFDIVDRHFGLYGSARWNAQRRPRAASVVHFHGPWAEESAASGGVALANGLKRAVENQRYRSADALVVLSEAFKTLLVDTYGVDKSKVQVIPPGVRPRLAARAQPASDELVVLCVRRLERRMGIDTLLDAWGIVSASLPNAELRIVGAGSEDENLRQQAGAVSGAVRFLGKVTDEVLADEYQRSTITVVPSRELEGFGLIALESLAQGKAPIVTDCGGLPDSVRGLDPSLIVGRESPVAMAERIIGALKGHRPTPHACISHAATFSWERAALAHLSLYEGLLDR